MTHIYSLYEILVHSDFIEDKGDYNIIDTVTTIFGKFELWEHKILGDTVPCKVIFDNKMEVGETFDYLGSFVFDFLEDCGFNPCEC